MDAILNSIPSLFAAVDAAGEGMTGKLLADGKTLFFILLSFQILFFFFKLAVTEEDLAGLAGQAVHQAVTATVIFIFLINYSDAVGAIQKLGEDVTQKLAGGDLATVAATAMRSALFQGAGDGIYRADRVEKKQQSSTASSDPADLLQGP